MKKVFVLLFSIIGLYAQIKDSITLKEVVITGEFTPVPKSSSVYQTITIKPQEVNNLGANTLSEAIMFQPLLEISQQSVFGASISMQGISGQNVKLLIDGVPVIGRLNGVIDLTQIPLNNIERVEIIQGPLSVFYGTDAFGGVINIITKKSQDQKFSANTSVLYESVNSVNFSSALGVKLGKNFLQGGFRYYDFPGYATDTMERSLNWNPRKQLSGNLNYSFDITPGLKIGYSGRYFYEKLADLKYKSRTTTYDKYYFTNRFDNVISLRGKINDKYIDGFVSYLNYRRFHDTYKIDPTTNEAILDTRDTRDKNIVKYDYIGSRLQVGTNNETKLNYAYGYQVKYEQTSGERIKDSTKNYYVAAVFGSINYKPVEKLDIRPSARFTYNSVFKSVITPALQVKYAFNSTNNIIFSYGNGFRAPSLKELYLNFIMPAGPITYKILGNENLKPEIGNHFAIYYNYSKVFNDNLLLKISPQVFYNDIKNMIALSVMVNNERYYINIEKFKSTGAKLNIYFGNPEKFYVNFIPAVIGRYNKYSEDYNTDEFLFSPEFTTKVSYKIPKVETFVNIYHKYYGRQPGFVVDNNNALEEIIRQDFSIINTSLSRNFWKNKINLTVGIKNLLNVTNIQTLTAVGQAHTTDMYLFGRTYFVKLNTFF